MPWLPLSTGVLGYVPNALPLKVLGASCPAIGDYVTQLNWNGSAWVGSGPYGGSPNGANYTITFQNGVFFLQGVPCAPILQYQMQSTYFPYTPDLSRGAVCAAVTVTVSGPCCGLPPGDVSTGVSIGFCQPIIRFYSPLPKCDCGCGCGAGGGGDGAIPLGHLKSPAHLLEKSAEPIRYSSGQVILDVDDLSVGGFGTPWGHTRSFANCFGYTQDLGQGWNWQVAQWPRLVMQSRGTMVLLGQANRLAWFDPNHAGGFTQRLGGASQLSYDSTGTVWQLTDEAGGLTEFDRFSGVFTQYFDPAGNVTQVVARGPGGEMPGEIQRSYTDAGGNSSVESLLYEYAQFSDYLYRVTSVTLRRQVNGGAWQNIRQALYTYHDGSTLFGALGDLKTVVTQAWQDGAWATLGTTLYRYWLAPGSQSSSSSGSSSGAAPGSSSSSFSSASSSSSSASDPWGDAHMLKYVVNADSYLRLAADPNAGSDPTLAPDWVVAQYADNYFEYDDNNPGEIRVTLEAVEGGSRTYRYQYQGDAGDAGVIGPSGDFNAWKGKTIETLPGGTQNITYGNYAGQVMLSVKVPAAGQGNGPWYEYARYDTIGRLVAKAESSAVTGYDDGYSDLLNCQASSSSSSSSGCNCPALCSGNLQYLADHAGLIHLYDYDPASGQVIRERIRNGELGCDNKLWEKTYQPFSATVGWGLVSSSSSSSSSSSAHGSSSSASNSSGEQALTLTTYLLTSETQFRDDITVDPSQSYRITTSYAYTLLPGTVRVQSRTTTWPVVATSQNGSGVADSRVDWFDQYGNLTWSKDERGFIQYRAYDIPTGGLVQSIEDVNTALMTGVPPGWSTRAGGGLHLVSDYTIDSLGRTVQTLGPWHEVDLGAVATNVRRASWTVYLDSAYTVYSGQGYATQGSSSSSSSSSSSGGTAAPAVYDYVLINPVSITITDPVGRVTDQISAIRSTNPLSLGGGQGEGGWATGVASAGALSSSDVFPQSSYCRWTTNQYADGTDLSTTRVYFSIPSSGIGVEGVNYNQSVFGYDILDRRNRVVSPGGTITRTIFDARDLPTAIWVGTNDNGATDSDPTGGGAPGNNMVVVTEYQYDGGLAGGDGNRTQETQHVDSSTTRVTGFTFDWRDRQVQVSAAQDWYQVTTLDNLDRTLQVDRHAQATGTAIASYFSTKLRRIRSSTSVERLAR